MSKHTPGPWKVYESGFEPPKEQGFSVSFSVGYGETDWRGPSFIVSMIKPHPYQLFHDTEKRLAAIDESYANACLIAAAPDMLRLLERLNFRKEDADIINLIKKAKGE